MRQEPEKRVKEIEKQKIKNEHYIYQAVQIDLNLPRIKRYRLLLSLSLSIRDYMKLIQTITGLLLIIISTANGFAGYGYVFGGFTEGAAKITVDAMRFGSTDPRFIEKNTKDGTKEITLNKNTTFFATALSTKYGIFGLFLIIFLWFQFAAGIILLAVNKLGTGLASLLLVIAIFGMAVELIGVTFTEKIGLFNCLGFLTSLSLGYFLILFYKKYQVDAVNEL